MFHHITQHCIQFFRLNQFQTHSTRKNPLFLSNRVFFRCYFNPNFCTRHVYLDQDEFLSSIDWYGMVVSPRDLWIWWPLSKHYSISVNPKEQNPVLIVKAIDPMNGRVYSFQWTQTSDRCQSFENHHVFLTFGKNSSSHSLIMLIYCCTLDRTSAGDKVFNKEFSTTPPLKSSWIRFHCHRWTYLGRFNPDWVFLIILSIFFSSNLCNKHCIIQSKAGEYNDR